MARWLEILKKEGILREEDGRLSRTGKEVAVPEKAGDAETYFKKLKPYLKHMVTGNEVPLDVFYQKEPALAPNMLLRRIPGCEETVERLVQGLRLCRRTQKRATPDYRNWYKGHCNYKTVFECTGRCKRGLYICGFFKIFSAGSRERTCGI